MNPKVDEYIDQLNNWQEEIVRLREIVLAAGLAEDYKWNQPCYTFQGKNVVIISKFKEYCALNFMKGTLLKDPDNILVAPGENSQSGRQLRFTRLSRINEIEATIKAYIQEAIEIEKSGLKIEFKKQPNMIILKNYSQNSKSHRL